MRQVAVDFANSRAAVSGARHFATATAHEWGLAPMVDVLALLVSEVVTNAVLHTDSAGVLRLSELDAGVRVDVADESTTRPTLGTVDLAAGSGRGLHLVDKLADAWGIDLREDGKVVWFELSAK